MSRIGKIPLTVPAGVKVTIAGSKVTIGGPLGTLNLTVPQGVKVAWNESEKSIVVSIDAGENPPEQLVADWGTTRAHVKNMLLGVTKGYEKSLEVVGVGWTAVVAGKVLKLSVGYANPINMPIPEGLKVTVDKQIVKVAGPDKQVVGHFAATMRAHRKPEPYNGKGIKFTNEVIKKKQGKQFGA
jgi:large subunit ribosomal protein L6